MARVALIQRTKSRARNYARGAQLERVVAADYAAQGHLAIRSAGSHGLADLVVLREGLPPLLVQVKSGRARMSRAERGKLARLAERYGCLAIAASQCRGGWQAEAL